MNITDEFLVEQFAGYYSFRLSWLYQQFIKAPEKILALFTGNRYGKCLEADSLVLMADGSYVKIKNIKSGDKVLSLNNDLLIQESKVLNLIDSGRQKTLIVKTRSGRENNASEVHPYLTIKGWKQLKDLKVGDYIATPRINRPSKNIAEDIWKYKLLGYLLGDGGISTGSVNITNVDPLIIDEIKGLIAREGYILRQCPDKITYRITKPKLSGKPNYYVQWLKKIGLMGKTSHTKFIPDFVFKSSNEMIAIFLSRLFSCDGWIDNRNIGYCSVSKELITGIQSLLLRFGIIVSINKKLVNYEYKNKTSKKLCYNIQIHRIGDIGIFYDRIGIYSKQKKLEKLWKKKEHKQPREITDTVPVNIKVLYNKIPEIAGNKKIKYSKGKYYGSEEYNLLREARGKTITRKKLGVIADVFKEDYLKKLSKSDIFWDKIVDIKDDGINETFDLEIQGTHNFIANNIFVHNTLSASRNYMDRILGVHNVARKNVLYFRCGLKENGQSIGHEFSPKQMKAMFPYTGHMIALDNTEQHDTKELCPECNEPIHEVKREDRVFRFASAALPMQGEDIYHRKRKGAFARHKVEVGEVKNNQHPAFKKLCPPYLIKKDCTTRAPTIMLTDPYDRGDIIIAFTSYKQSLVEKTGQNLLSVWYDEQASEDEVSDGKARVVFEKGDIIVTCTPIDFISFYFNEIFEQARVIYRTKTIVDFLKEDEGVVYPQIEYKDSDKSIAVFWAATDDNPLIDVREIPDLLMSHDDPMMNKIKRYGLFKQISGRIFPKYNDTLHTYESDKIFNPFAYN